MTCGIYILYYETDDFQYYIGKSINIEGRYKEHCRDLRNNTHRNKGLLSGFSEFGIPTCSILEILPCEDIVLYSKEKEWISIFDSFNKGFNETPGGLGTGYGENNPTSKYPNEKIIEVFDILVDHPEVPLTRVSKNTCVNLSVIKNISQGVGHTWLSSMYPERYMSMLSLLGTRGSIAHKSIKRLWKVYPTLIDPTGVEHTINNVKDFSKLHGLHDSSVYNLMKGNVKSHKGWKLA